MRIWFLAIATTMAALLSAGAALTDRFAGDLFLARTVQGVRSAPVEETMEMASFMGQTFFMAAMAFVLFIWALWKGRRAEYMAFGGALLSLGVNPLLKVLVARPRPTQDLVTVWEHQGDLSYPSGHAFTAMVLLGLLYYLAPGLLPWRKAVVMVRACLSLAILLIGVSRVYLGAHWPSDVLGGFLVGGIVLALLVHLHRLQSSRSHQPRQT